ncbi:MAG: hypothetical protein RhofKO_32210 [Rhodothermales bacterium]
MNGFALAAGLLTLAAFGAHAWVGAREFRLFAPPPEAVQPRTAWVQGLAGWHWVSVDLLASAVLFLLMGLTAWLPNEGTLLLVLSGYFALTGLAWLSTLILAGGGVPNQYLKLGQWLFCFLVAGLAWLAR